MLAIQTVAFCGMEAVPVQVEAEISSGLPRFIIVGLPDAIVSESKVRISRALSRYLPPTKVITVNLSPASIRKEGSHYDLPIALCLLVGLKVLPKEVLEDYVAFGELTLNGNILPCKGVLLAAMNASETNKKLICSGESAADVELLGCEVVGMSTLNQLIQYFNNTKQLQYECFVMDKKSAKSNNLHNMNIHENMNSDQDEGKNRFYQDVAGQDRLLQDATQQDETQKQSMSEQSTLRSSSFGQNMHQSDLLTQNAPTTHTVQQNMDQLNMFQLDTNKHSCTLKGQLDSSKRQDDEKTSNNQNKNLCENDFFYVKGQESAKLALEIAAAGGHHALMIGSPGAGKSMLAHSFTSILPPITPQQSLEATLIHNLSGKPIRYLVTNRPFRDPHHSSSTPAMVGGGAAALPGEISLAHNGVLFLDEFPEFSRSTLQSLREAMETGKITVSRAQAHHCYPARFQLIAAMNPCKCGMLGEGKCKSGPKCTLNYWEKISGPLLDRFDLCVSMETVPSWELFDLEQKGETSAEIKSRVMKAQDLQIKRQNCLNSQLSPAQMDKFITLDTNLRSFIRERAKFFALSSRGFAKLLKVARTIADLKDVEFIDKNALTLASSFKFAWNNG